MQKERKGKKAHRKRRDRKLNTVRSVENHTDPQRGKNTDTDTSTDKMKKKQTEKKRPSGRK